MIRQAPAVWLATCLAGCGAASPVVSPPEPVAPPAPVETPADEGLALPVGARATWLLRAADLGPRAPADLRVRARLPDRGPALIAGDAFLVVPDSAAETWLAPFAVPGAHGASDATWMQDGALALVVGNQLGLAGPRGFEPVVELPATGMHVAPASTDSCFLFGGARLLAYRRDGNMLDLLRLPAGQPGGERTDIAAVAGDLDRFFVATGSSVLMVAPGQVPAILYDEGAATPIGSLAPAPGGVFVGSTRGVTFVAADGTAIAPVLRGRAAQVASRGDVLYVWTEGEGLLRVSPTTGYAELAARSSRRAEGTAAR